MSLDQRLTRLAPALTAHERAMLILQAWKDGRQEDPAWRYSMPQDQSNAFNRYIELMNRANVVLGRMIGVINMQAEALEQRQAWLVSMTLWLEHIEEIRRAVRLTVREPITQSEHSALVEAARNEWVPVQELAEFLAADRDDYADDDYEEDEGSLVIKDGPWARAVAEEDQRLRSMVQDGKLASRGEGKAMKLQEGALEHFGHAVGAACEDYLSYRIVPDDQAEEAAREREDLKRLQQVLDWQPLNGPVDEEFGSTPGRMLKGLQESTAYRLIVSWMEMRSVDMLLSEIGKAFNGIDPLRPVFRDKQESTRARLEAVKDHMLQLGLDVELREPLAEELDEMRGWLEELPATP